MSWDVRDFRGSWHTMADSSQWDGPRRDVLSTSVNFVSTSRVLLEALICFSQVHSEDVAGVRARVEGWPSRQIYLWDLFVPWMLFFPCLKRILFQLHWAAKTTIMILDGIWSYQETKYPLFRYQEDAYPDSMCFEMGANLVAEIHLKGSMHGQLFHLHGR